MNVNEQECVRIEMRENTCTNNYIILNIHISGIEFQIEDTFFFIQLTHRTLSLCSIYKLFERFNKHSDG